VTPAGKAAVTASFACAVWLACSVTNIHAFIAGQYLETLDCVTPGYAIDVLNGPMVDASCDATCVIPPFDSGVYVTGACPPFPEGEDTSGTSPVCVKALAAIHRNDLCLDGGPSNPVKDSGTPPATDASGKDAGTGG